MSTLANPAVIHADRAYIPAMNLSSSDYGSSWCSQPAPDLAKQLAPLLSHLAAYDAVRVRLETRGGHIRDLQAITAMLNQVVLLDTPNHAGAVKLAEPDTLQSVQNCFLWQGLHIQVRQLPTGMPVYYLCRVRHDYYSNYPYILEDIYCSPGFPILDWKFVKLMYFGHETSYLRLSVFRQALGDLLPSGPQPPGWEADNRLARMGQCVFQAAWHEDQFLAEQVAAFFAVPALHQAVEVLYLCLNSELCYLRDRTTPDMLTFLETVYPQPLLHRFLSRLPQLEGAALTAIQTRGLKCYSQLAHAFAAFLGTPAVWGFRHETVPLYKIIYGNLSRLPLVAELLHADPNVAAAASVLTHEAQRITDELLEII